MNSPAPRTLEQVNEGLSSLGFPPIDARQLGFVNDTEGTRFWACFDKAVLLQDRRSVEIQYVAKVLTPMSPGAMQVIQTLGFDPHDLPELVQISKAEGADFRRALKAVGEGAPDADAAASYLTGLMSGAVQRAATGQTSPARVAPRPPLAEATGQGRSKAESGGEAVARPAVPASDGHQRALPPEQRSVLPIEAPLGGQRLSQAEYGRSVHFYGTRSAACVSADVSRRNIQTVKIDFASAVGPRHYDWANKQQIQLAPGEVALLYGVLTGLADQVAFHHAGRDTKRLVVKQQSGAYYFAFTAGKESFALQLVAQDAFMVLGLLLSQLCSLTPNLPVEAVEALVKRTCELQRLAEQPKVA